jgi:hypothetical protein
MQTMRTTVSALAALSIWLFATLAHAQCGKDTDCKGDRVCENGVCVAGVPAAPGTPAVETAPAAAPPAAAPAAPPPVAAAPAAAPQADVALSETKPKMKRHSPAMMAIGIVMVAAAPVAFITAYMANANCVYVDVTGPESCRDETTPLVLTVVGFGLLGGGIPLIVIGAKKEPVSGSATLTPWATPNGAGAALKLTL